MDKSLIMQFLITLRQKAIENSVGKGENAHKKPCHLVTKYFGKPNECF